jgi:hypothetical protein
MGFFMSGWTTTDLENLEQAIKDLALGARVVSIDLGGKARSLHETSLKALRELRLEMKAELDSASESTGARRVQAIPVSNTW